MHGDAASRIKKYEKLVTNELISELEFIHAAISLMISTEDYSYAEKVYAELSDSRQSNVLYELDRMQEDGYVWTPPLIGSGYTEKELAIMKNGLINAHARLKQISTMKG
jgi:hypothetical protein